MYAWLVINEFLNSNKFNEIYKWLERATIKHNNKIDVFTNSDLLICNGKFLNPDITKMPDYVIFWDKDIVLAKQLENMGLKLFNNSRAIEICDNKALTYVELNGKIEMPDTIVCPMTYRNIGYNKMDFVNMAEERLGYPMVVKECCGSFGQQVYLAKNRQDIESIFNKTKEPLIFQKFIDNCVGRDIRLNVVGDKVVASMLRYNDNDFRANITNGGSMEKYNPTQEEVKMAIDTCKALNLDFGGVDILINNAGISIIGLFQDLSRADWMRLMDTNVGSVYNCCHFAIPHMVHEKCGKIINISSVWGIAGASCEAAYSASKGAVNALTRALAKELAPSNIQVNAIACGVIDTDMNGFLSVEERTALEAEIPAGRFAQPEEVAEAVLQVIKMPTYLTGQVISMDGGYI